MTRLRTIRSRGALAVIAALLVVPAAFAMHAFPDDETTDASRDNVFAQNKQNEPAVAIDPSNPMNVVAGANDEIDLESCNVKTDNTCPFTPGVGLTGVSFSTNGGVSFSQPEYTGYSTRHCLGLPFLDTDGCTPNPSGPIGTLPWYFENGLVSDGDPIAAFGPRPGANGQFSWANGSRLYFINLTSNFADTRDEATFKGVEAIAVSRTDNVPLAATGGPTGKAAWMHPVIISRRLSTVTFSDKEQIWADNAASSPYFGNAYACWVSFRSNGGAPEPVMFSRSTDGGNTWSAPDQLSPAANTGLGQGRQGCTVRTGSDGVVYVFWEGAFQKKENAPFFSSAQLMARSFDGGDSFERPRAVVPVTDCGRFDPAQGRYTFDGVAGARTNSFPMVDIANGAPSGPGPNTIVMTFCDGLTSTTASTEQAPVWYSTDRGETWRKLTANAAQAGDRPDFPAIAISPDGTDVYVAYDAFHQPWQTTTANARPFEGVVRHSSFGPTFTTVHRGQTGDARAASTNGLVAEFLGDYNYVSATNNFAVAVWNDAREAADCPAIDTWRQNRVNYLTGATATPPGDPPRPHIDCTDDADPNTSKFGNTDIWSTRVDDPS